MAERLLLWFMLLVFALAYDGCVMAEEPNAPCKLAKSYGGEWGVIYTHSDVPPDYTCGNAATERVIHIDARPLVKGCSLRITEVCAYGDTLPVNVYRFRLYVSHDGTVAFGSALISEGGDTWTDYDLELSALEW